MIRWRHVDYITDYIKACLITFVLNNQSEYISNYAEYPKVIKKFYKSEKSVIFETLS